MKYKQQITMKTMIFNIFGSHLASTKYMKPIYERKNKMRKTSRLSLKQKLCRIKHFEPKKNRNWPCAHARIRVNIGRPTAPRQMAIENRSKSGPRGMANQFNQFYCCLVLSFFHLFSIFFYFSFCCCCCICLLESLHRHHHGLLLSFFFFC